MVHECAYEHWHGMLFARFLAENSLLIEPEVGVAVTLGDCEELGKERGFDKWMMAAHFAHEMLPQVFRPAHPVFEVRLAREHRLKLEGLVESLPADVFLARDSLGWVYQFWQSRKKDEVNRSGSKIGADELPAVTQLFTEPYMVSFLLDNSLGAWWAARRLSKSDLRHARSEVELRRMAAIPGVPLEYLRFVRNSLSTSETGEARRDPNDETAGRHPPASLHTAFLPSAQGRPSPSGRGAGGEGKRARIPARILEYARDLRSNHTDAEQLLWGLLRSRRFAGKKFRRQHPIGRYILDFYCHESKLAVELDGGQHNDGEAKLRDDSRSGFLKEKGIRVVRFWNHDVLLHTELVLESLWQEVHAGSFSSSPSPQTPLPEGEGLTASSSPEGEGIMPVEEGFRWAPGAGAFGDWPEHLGELRIIDPCCGSGHFLVAVFSMLVPMRMNREGLAAREAVDAVLRENLYGLELDPRCVELAAFALALAAWTYPDAGGYRPLPALNLACSGLSVGTTKDRWVEIASGRRNLRIALDWLYDEFRDAPVLGSLLNPVATRAAKLVDWPVLATALVEALAREESDERRETAVAAQGLAKAAELLSRSYHLVATNVPYLARGKQVETLRRFCEQRYPAAKHDLATVFLERCLELCAEGGSASIVLPKNWLFLASYKRLREKLLKAETWHLLVRLGSKGFQTPMWDFNVQLLILSRGRFTGRVEGLFGGGTTSGKICGSDVSEFRTASEKAGQLATTEIASFEQARQLKNPDARVIQEEETTQKRLESFCASIEGLTTGDLERFVGKFWEGTFSGGWEPYIQNVESTAYFGARTDRILWENGDGVLTRFPTAHNFPGTFMNGKRVLGNAGLRVTQMGALPVTVYTGEVFGKNGATVIPDDPKRLPSIWCFCASEEYRVSVRRIDQSLKVTNATLARVPFDLDRWTKVAKERYPNGLPRPYSDDPTQWIFHGHPCGSVVWDDTEKWTAHGPLRTDSSVLQVAVARLLGYRWPAEQDDDMELVNEQREWMRRAEALSDWADEDGIVCIPSVRGEPPAGERILGLLAAAYEDVWNEGMLTKLLAEAGSQSLDDWLRNHFFEQHCKLFHHRPFVWHIWDGRRRDGFHAFVSYHKLVEGDSKGRRLLESLTYSYLGDWINRQKDGVQRGEPGAADRLVAAKALEERLAAIIKGEPPFDIFVRWKPVHEQPVGWEPDINDGVRFNIRPFMSEDIPGGKKGAGILRAKPNVHWRKDRGKEPLTRGRRAKPPWLEDEDWDPEDERELRPQQDYPWYWPDDVFTGDRRNDIHLSVTDKSAYRLAAERTRR